MADQSLFTLGQIQVADIKTGNRFYVVTDPGVGDPEDFYMSLSQVFGNTLSLIPLDDGQNYDVGSGAVTQYEHFWLQRGSLLATTARDGHKGFESRKAAFGATADCFLGMDNVANSFLSARSVAEASANTDNRDDYSNTYWGNEDDPVVYFNYGAGDGGLNTVSEPATLMGMRNGGAWLGWYENTLGVGGGGLMLNSDSARSGTLLQHEFFSAESNTHCFAMRSGANGMSHLNITEMRIGGGDVENVSPCDADGTRQDDVIDLGTTSNRWKNGYFGGDVWIDGALDHNGSTVGFYNTTPVAQSAAYTLTATQVPSHTLAANAAASPANNNAVLSALITDLQATGLIA